MKKTSLVVPLSFLQAKQMLMNLLFENLLLGLMPANYAPTRCVNPCPPVLIRVGTSIQKPLDSQLDKARPVALKKWSCLIFNEQDLIVKSGASTLLAEGKNDQFSLDGFGSHCNNVFVAMHCFYDFYFYQEPRPSLTEEDIQRGSKKRTRCIEATPCERWRLYKTTNPGKNISENIFLTCDNWQLSNYQKI